MIKFKDLLKETSWESTSWTKDGKTVTIKQILDLTKNVSVEEIPIDDDFKNLMIKHTIDKNRVKNADLSKPILLLVDDRGKILSILDGNHRAHKAIETGQKNILGKKINVNKLPPEIQDVLK